jgi:hypothetical protein
MRSNDECFITALSTDIIYSILDFIPYESHLDFACTCKMIADCSSNILKRHQEASKTYRVASDISPTTIPTLLRSAFGCTDPILAWHVRSLEIWYDRTSWRDWKPLRFDKPLHEENLDVESTSWKWRDDEIGKYLETFDDQSFAAIDGSDEDISEDAREQFAGGIDGIAKALLIAHCPKLQGITFVTREHKENSTLSWVRRIAQGSILHGSHWPPGLCSIENVAVGVESDTWMTKRDTENDFNQMDGSNKSMEIFSTLLRLPRINSIYYNGLRASHHDDQTDYASNTLMLSRTSTIKQIFLDDCDDMPDSFRWALTAAARALETFTLRAGNSGHHRMDNADQLVSGLSGDQSKSLQTLMFYGPYTWSTIHGYRCSVYRNEELEKARNLRTVAINISDVELDCFYSMSDEISTQEQCREFFIKWFHEKAFPPSVERLVFWGLPDECYIPGCEGKFIDWLEDALIHVIQSSSSIEGCEENHEEEGRTGEDHEGETHDEEDYEGDDLSGDNQDEEEQEQEEQEEDDQEEEDQEEEDQEEEDEDSCDELSNPYKSSMRSLRAVYLEEIERQYTTRDKRGQTDQERTGDQPCPEKVYFRRLAEAAQEANIDVHTLTNRAPAKHIHDFPKAPDKYDLRSGPWWERRDETKEWVFDVYQGRRVPPGCEKCGRCEQCLRVYDEVLWRSLDE